MLGTALFNSAWIRLLFVFLRVQHPNLKLFRCRSYQINVRAILRHTIPKMGKLRSALLESLKLIKEAIPALAHDDDRQKLLDAQELIRETIRDGILDIDDVKKKLTAIPISRFGAAKPVEKILGLTNIATASEDFWRLRKIEYFRMPSHLSTDL